MLTNTIKTALIGGKAAALATFLATTAIAQQAVPTPEGNVAIVPDAALEAQSSATAPEIGYATLTGFDNDQVVAETMIAQGFTGIVINRTGPIMTVSAQRDGVPTELVYSLANGRLMSVDGVDFPHPADAVADGESGASAGVVNTGPAGASDGGAGSTGGGDGTDGGVQDDAADDDGSDGGAAGDGGAGGTGEGSDDGTSDGTDAGGDGGSDGGAESEGESSGDSDGDGTD